MCHSTSSYSVAMTTIAVMNTPLPSSNKTSAIQARMCLDPLTPPPHPSIPFSLHPDDQEPPPRTHALPCQVVQHQSPRSAQDWALNANSHTTPRALSSASSAASTSNASQAGAHEATPAVATRYTKAGDALLLQPLSTPPLPTSKSYGTASDSSSSSCSGGGGSRSRGSAVVTIHSANQTLYTPTTEAMGSDTSNSHAEFQSPQCRRYKGPDPLVGTTPPHQAASLPQQHQRHLEPSEGQVRFDDMVEILTCDPHATAHPNGTACVYGGNVKSNPATFTGGAVLAPSMAGRSANEDAEATESRQPRIPVAGDNEHVDGSALWSTQSPPSFVELVLRRIQTTSLLQFLWVLLLVVMLLVGNAFQVIFLNFWIHQFPTRLTRTSPSMSSSPASNESDGHGSEDGIKALASSYTTFVISAFVFPTFFLVLFIVYALWRRPNLGFTREWAGWRLLFGIGAMDALNSIMAIYAAANTPEVLQALFVSLVPIYSAVFTKWLLKDKRDYANPYVIVSFLLIATGVAIASLFNYAATHHHDMKGGPGAAGNRTAMKDSLFDFFLGGSSSRQTSSSPSVALDRRLWCFVFFLSVPPTVLMNVWQTMYMIRYTSNDQLTDCLADYANDEENEEGGDDAASISAVQSTRVLDDNADHHCDAAHRPSALAPVSTQTLAGSASGSLSSASAPTQHHPLHGEDTSVKLVMLTSDTAIQAIMALLLLPVDALPWFGGSDSIREVVQNLEEGIDCVLHCPHNMTFCILYSTGFVLVYIASAYLNRYSVTLCSMVSQLSGPITALILIAFPSLNMTGDASPWYVSIFAIIVLSCGTVVYVYWDEMTMEKKMEGEMQLKWDMVQQQQQHQHQRSHRPLQSSSGGPSYHEVDNGTHNTSPRSASQPQCPRHSRSRRYRRRPQSEYVVVFDQNVTNPADNGEPQRL